MTSTIPLKKEESQTGTNMLADGLENGASSVSSHRQRGPRPSPAKQKRDAARVETHRAKLAAPGALSQPAEPALSLMPREGALEPISEGRHASCGVIDVRKRAEKERLRQQQVAEHAARAVNFATTTKHASGDAVTADNLDLDVGRTRLLEDAKLKVSEETKIYGLVGPNGCGKTTLLRAIAGEFGPECQPPIPRSWGKPYLVDQLEPEPSGLSPIEEVLSGDKERSALLERLSSVTDGLDAFYKKLEGDDFVSDGEQQAGEELAKLQAEIEEQLVARWGAAEQQIARILVGLGFCDGERSADGAPSIRARDELVVGIDGLKLNGPAEVRDHCEEEWLRGTVTSLEPLMVQPGGYHESFTWAEVRHARELSGGWRKKVSLAKALWLKPKLLLLDEPTNHLDFHALLWLEEELKSYEHTVVIVSHNACFLAEVCNKALQITGKKIETIQQKYLSADILADMQRVDESHRKFRDWRFDYPKGDKPELHGLSFHNVSFSYSPQAPPVLQDVHRDVVRFNGNSRTAILGRNGSGKSTLLKLCLGIEKPTHGDVDVSCQLRHFSQHFHEALNETPDRTAAEYLVEKCSKGIKDRFGHTDTEQQRVDAREVLSWFGLGSRAASETQIKDLSGGQKARLNFAFLNLCPAHLLVLDEPTNHLDANGLEHLVDALKHFKGGVVLVSHDEHLIRKVLASKDKNTELLICDGGFVRQQPGGLEAYRRAAYLEQHQKAEMAAKSAALRQEASRQERLVHQARPRGRKHRASTSSASTRESTPETQTPTTAAQTDPAQAALEAHFTKKKATKKPKPINFNRQ